MKKFINFVVVICSVLTVFTTDLTEKYYQNLIRTETHKATQFQLPTRNSYFEKGFLTNETNCMYLVWINIFKQKVINVYFSFW